MEVQMYNEIKDELFQLIENEMSDGEEQLFMKSYKLFLQYGSNSQELVINFDIVWNWVGFTKIGNAKTLLTKNFIEHKDYIKLASFSAEASLSSSNQHGGHNKETILLTVDCFKNFCMKAGTTRANEVRQYYIKMENILHKYIQSKFLELRDKDIQTQMTITDLHYKNTELEKYKPLNIENVPFSIFLGQIPLTFLNDTPTECVILNVQRYKTHEFLIKYNRKKNLVYFCILQSFIDGSFIMKVGWSKDIETRIPALNAGFGTKCIVLNVFVCEDSYNLEQFLHNSQELVKYKYNNLINNKISSTETYHIPNHKEYEKIVKFTNNEMNKYNSIEIIRLRVEEKKIDVEEQKIELIASLIPICKNYEEVMSILNKISSPLIQINENLENDNIIIQNQDTEPEIIQTEEVGQEDIETGELDEEENEIEEEVVVVHDVEEPRQTQTNANSNGPIVQVYHKDDLKTVVYVFDSITEATRDFKYKNYTASFTCIKKAHQHKILYLDHRWFFISNRKEPNLKQMRDIGETVITRERNQGQVVMLNIDKTKILKVFKISRHAAEEILQHPSAMSSAIKFSTPLNNYYWMRWENVDKPIQDEYLLLNSLPEKHKNVRGIKINQFDPNTNVLIKTFPSYTDIQKELKISPKKIKEIIETNDNYQGKYVFKFA